MSWIDLYSKREKAKKKAGQEDVFRYDELPEPFRVQVIHIWKDAIGIWEGGYDECDKYDPMSHHDSSGNRIWELIFSTYIKEKGVFRLTDAQFRNNPCDQCCIHLLKATTEDALDLIELVFRYIDKICIKILQY